MELTMENLAENRQMMDDTVAWVASSRKAALAAYVERCDVSDFELEVEPGVKRKVFVIQTKEFLNNKD